jgi:sulfite exporter TauE/SafE
MVYSMLLMALSSGSASQGALLLACFGLGTLPAIGTMSLGFKRWNGHSGFKTQLARRMVAGLAGLWALFSLYSLTVSAPLQHIH